MQEDGQGRLPTPSRFTSERCWWGSPWVSLRHRETGRVRAVNLATGSKGMIESLLRFDCDAGGLRLEVWMAMVEEGGKAFRSSSMLLRRLRQRGDANPPLPGLSSAYRSLCMTFSSVFQALFNGFLGRGRAYDEYPASPAAKGLPPLIGSHSCVCHVHLQAPRGVDSSAENGRKGTCSPIRYGPPTP